MSDKGGFFEGFLEGLDKHEKEVDSPQLEEVKNFIRSKELTHSERVGLATWLFGDALKSAIIEGLTNDE